MTYPLSDTDYALVLSMYKKTKSKRESIYLNIILLKYKNYSQIMIADILNIDENTVCTWLKKFAASSTIEEYLSNNNKGYVGKLSYSFVGKAASFLLNTGISDSKRLISYIYSCFGVKYTVSGAIKMMSRLSFSYKQKVNLPAKLDVEKQLAFVKKYDLIMQNLTPKCAIFFMDGVHPQHNTHTLKAWLPKGAPTYILSNTGRNRLNINGLYNPHTNEVIVTYHKTINAQAVIETFEALQKKHSTMENLYVFADNAKYYTCAVIKAYLAENPAIKLIHLPTYSPNLNLIERLWKYTRKIVINPVYYEKFSEFTTAIKSFFETIDQHKDELNSFIGQKFRLFSNLSQNPKTNFH
jgi:transposase